MSESKGYLSFDGIDGATEKMLLYGLVGLLQVIVLFLQVFSVNQALYDKCPLATTTVERETGNWSAWLNFLSLIFVGLWGMARKRELKPLYVYLIKIVWIGVTAISSILAAVSMGHSLTVGSKCPNLDSDDVRNTSVAIVVLWIILLALGHMGKKDEYKHKKDDSESPGVEDTSSDNVNISVEKDELLNNNLRF